MRVAVTGTPGTGKTTATELVDTDLELVHLNDVIRDEDLATGRDEDRDSLVADLDAVDDWLDDRDDLLIDSHLAHRFDADRVVVLRCHPEELERRLEERGEPRAKAEENAESEALDVILAEAVERHGEESVYEIDATDSDPESIAREIERVIDGEREPSAGTVSFIDYL
ncbi:adenylate kinase [Halorientalis sp. IM1011]|uniref:adenylate kinase family protein n=1 Tax=Halorientalis sp. IM1011 TaxID=1932360 RepID=UPI00097CCDFC|nr:AAA family ATPase [Halorientalis sp. IM1011]AQL41229.1 adenylate kinase [Halorientalis sp. IM1011]